MRSRGEAILRQSIRTQLEALEAKLCLHAELNLTVNFQPPRAPTPTGTLPDTGNVYASRGNALSYGWNASMSGSMRARNQNSNPLLDSFVLLSNSSRWELELPNGDYDLTIYSGDARYRDGVHDVWAEQTRIVYGVQSARKQFIKGSKTVTVADGRLTLRAGPEAVNAKVNFVSIRSRHPAPEFLPEVSVTALDAEAAEAHIPATLRFTRSSQQLSSPLTLRLDWSGSASSADVFSSPRSLTFAPGESVIEMAVLPVDDALVEGSEGRKVTLLADAPHYRLKRPTSAGFTILDNDAEPPPPPPPAVLSDITWSNTSAPPVSYTETTSVVLDSKIYLVGGFNSSFTPQKSVFVFDGTTWTARSDAPKAFTNTADAAISDNLAWFAGGYIGNTFGQTFGTSEVLTYDAASDTWGTAPPLPAARARGSMVKLGQSVYYFGGENFNRTADMTDVWAIDLNNLAGGWVSKAPMPMPRNQAAVVEAGGKIYILSGQTGYDANLVTHDDILIYDPASDAWTLADQKLPGGKSHISQSAFFVHDRIVVVAGESAHNTPTQTVWSIHPQTLVTSLLTDLPESRTSVAAAVLNDRLYVFGGYRGYIPGSAYVGTFVLQ